MKIIYYPHKGENRTREGEKWKSGLKWGADFMLENIIQNIQEHDIFPCYDLNWDNVKEADIVWFHNIATTAYYNIPILNISPIPSWVSKKERPIIIGGVRGLVGFERSKKLLKYFDGVHTGSVDLYNKSVPYNKNAYVFYPGVNTELFKPLDEDGPEVFTLGWAGDKNKKMKNFQIIEKLGYPYNIASKENYIPHDKMPNFYSSISVYTHFSSHEGGNRTILEACSCGIPVVSTDAGAVNQYIDDEWIIPYKDNEEYLIREFKTRLKDFENDLELIKKVGLNNRKKALKFDWKIVSKKWLNIINETYNQIRK
jgi:glycosyltransferase involved in cell wall biosynthesis